MRPRTDERGIAMISSVLVLMIMTSLVVITITVAIHSNDKTQFDRRRENAFGAATAGIDDALRCLSMLDPNLPVATCNVVAGSGSQLSDSGQAIGQYEVAITDLSPGSYQKTVVVQSSGWGTTKTGVEAERTARAVSAEVQLTPIGGFFEAIFAGGSSPQGQVTFKNSASVVGGVYARSFESQKNGAALTDLRVVGDVEMKNNDVYRSIWSGGSVTMGQNALVQTNVQACGAGSSPGNATLGSGSQILGNLRFKGTYNGGGTVGSTTWAGCDAPQSVALPTFSFNAFDYPGWTILSFSTVATANACLAQAGGTQLQQTLACGGALGDLDGTVGRNASGTLIYANIASCTSPLRFGGATFTGDFTIVTNCKLDIEKVLTKHASAVGNKQAVFISTSATGSEDLTASITSADASLGILLYTAGELSTKNSLTIAAGSLYGASINLKNSLSINVSADLSNNPPAGFVFDESIVTRYIPVITLWQQN